MDTEKIKQIILSVAGEGKLPDGVVTALTASIEKVFEGQEPTEERITNAVSSLLPSLGVTPTEKTATEEDIEKVAEELPKDENPVGTPNNPIPLPDEDKNKDDGEIKADETSEAQKTKKSEEEAKEALRNGETETDTSTSETSEEVKDEVKDEEPKTDSDSQEEVEKAVEETAEDIKETVEEAKEEQPAEQENILLDQIQNPEASTQQQAEEIKEEVQNGTTDENVLLSQIEDLKSENERITLELSQKAQEELHASQLEAYKAVLEPVKEVGAQYSLLVSLFDDLHFKDSESFEAFLEKVKTQVASLLQELANKGLQMTPPGVGAGGSVNLLADQINAKTKELNKTNN